MSKIHQEHGRFLTLAGEHTCAEYNGSVFAALIEGKRAAREVVSCLNSLDT